MSDHVFISHSTRNQDIAHKVCSVLERHGVRCWIAPRDVEPGSDYGASLIDAISESKVMVLVLSAESNTSPQVRREVERAASKGIVIVPFMIEHVNLSKSLEFFISAHHWLDATAGPMNRHIAKLVDTVKDLARTTPGKSDGRTPEPAQHEAAPATHTAAASSEAISPAGKPRVEAQPPVRPVPGQSGAVDRRIGRAAVIAASLAIVLGGVAYLLLRKPTVRPSTTVPASIQSGSGAYASAPVAVAGSTPESTVSGYMVALNGDRPREAYAAFSSEYSAKHSYEWWVKYVYDAAHRYSDITQQRVSATDSVVVIDFRTRVVHTSSRPDSQTIASRATVVRETSGWRIRSLTPIRGSRR